MYAAADNVDDGMNIDNWAFEELTEAVIEFRSIQDQMNAQDTWQDVEEEQRELAPCLNIAHDPTKLSFKKISVKITHH